MLKCLNGHYIKPPHHLQIYFIGSSRCFLLVFSQRFQSFIVENSIYLIFVCNFLCNFITYWSIIATLHWYFQSKKESLIHHRVKQQIKSVGNDVNLTLCNTSNVNITLKMAIWQIFLTKLLMLQCAMLKIWHEWTIMVNIIKIIALLSELRNCPYFLWLYVCEKPSANRLKNLKNEEKHLICKRYLQFKRSNVLFVTHEWFLSKKHDFSLKIQWFLLSLSFQF